MGRLVRRPGEAELQALAGRTQARAVLPNSAERLEAGRAALAEGHLGQALSLFAEAAVLNPEDPWPWHGRGDALISEADPEGALAAYDQAASLAPESGLVEVGRGNALERLGRHEEAIAAWTLALRREPDLEWARAGLSRHGALPASEEDE
ncbi:MAG: tetratricopeptide repeat protein [Myxococcota bacterium]|nr:tetratricopeptide repeat protein [Myxococcota bacterium]